MISEDDKNLEKYKSELIKILNNVQKYISSVDILKNYDSEIKEEDIQIIKFSNNFYKKYMEEKELLKDYKIFNELNRIKNKDELKDFYETKIKDKIKLPKKYEIPDEGQFEKKDIISVINKKLKYIKSISENDKNKYGEKIARYYYYMINNQTELNFFKNSGFIDFKINMNTLLYTSNIFYQKSLKHALAKYFKVICDYFMKIKISINIDKETINTNYFNDENKNKELEKLNNNIKDGENEIDKRYDECQKSIEKMFNSLINNLNDKRKDFKIKEDALLKKAVEEFNQTNAKIEEITNNIIAKNQNLKNEILNNSKKYIKNKRNNYKGYSYTMSEFEGHIEDNIAQKMSKETVFNIYLLIPYINLIPAGIFVIAGLFDYFRDHSKEYQKEIDRINDIFIKKINEIKNDQKSNIQLIKEHFLSEINNIFEIFGEDSKIIEMNSQNLLNIINNFERFLDNLLLYVE